MKLKEILGGLYVMITEEEEDLITKYFSEGDYVNESQLSGREMRLAEELSYKGVLVPTLRGYKTV
jgi:cobalamin-dependent methionine synthase I